MKVKAAILPQNNGKQHLFGFFSFVKELRIVFRVMRRTCDLVFDPRQAKVVFNLPFFDCFKND